MFHIITYNIIMYNSILLTALQINVALIRRLLAPQKSTVCTTDLYTYMGGLAVIASSSLIIL